MKKELTWQEREKLLSDDQREGKVPDKNGLMQGRFGDISPFTSIMIHHWLDCHAIPRFEGVIMIPDDTIEKLKLIISKLPPMRWNISEKSSEPDEVEFPYGYFGDEWDNWEHLDINERAEYFGKIFSCVKELKDIIESLKGTK